MGRSKIGSENLRLAENLEMDLKMQMNIIICKVEGEKLHQND